MQSAAFSGAARSVQSEVRSVPSLEARVSSPRRRVDRRSLSRLSRVLAGASRSRLPLDRLASAVGPHSLPEPVRRLFLPAAAPPAITSTRATTSYGTGRSSPQAPATYATAAATPPTPGPCVERSRGVRALDDSCSGIERRCARQPARLVRYVEDETIFTLAELGVDPEEEWD